MRCWPAAHWAQPPRTLAPIHSRTLPPSVPRPPPHPFTPPLSSASLLLFPSGSLSRPLPPLVVVVPGNHHGCAAGGSRHPRRCSTALEPRRGPPPPRAGARSLANLMSRKPAGSTPTFTRPRLAWGAVGKPAGGATVWSSVAGCVVNGGGSPSKRRAGATSSKELQPGGGEDASWDYLFTSGWTLPHLGNKRRNNPAEEFGEEEEQAQRKGGGD